MIQIDRSSRFLYIDGKPVHLGMSEYDLMVSFAMMGNRVIPHDLLLEIALGSAIRLPNDKNALHSKISRLRKKMGADIIRAVRIGYVYIGTPIEFIG